MRLFVERARAIRPSFALTAANAETIAALCRALDGLPLALELAAARIPLLSPEAILAQMTDRLVAAQRWSARCAYPATDDLGDDRLVVRSLSDEAQSLFRSLSVFAGGFTLERRRPLPRRRCTILTTMPGSSLGRAKLGPSRRGRRRVPLHDAGNRPRVRVGTCGRRRGRARERHAAWFIDLVASLQAWEAAYLPEGQEILDQLETEHANLHAALTWLRDTGDVSGLLALAGDLVDFW